MHILYLDDAGSVGNPNERHFILAGIALFERQTFFLERSLDQVAARFRPDDPQSLEFHGSQILPGRGFWRKVPRPERRQVLLECLATVRLLHGRCALFGAVIDKSAAGAEDSVELAFEEVASRFDRFLLRLHRAGQTQRGLIVLDKSTMETRLQSLTREFRSVGHRWGVLRNLADVPFFVDSRASRLVQYADLVSYALWQKFENADSEFFDLIGDAFDSEGGVQHGLVVR